jgi:serine phosphatase RsbU (regulator of sigma subunit)/anti-sigma regulatory factor (Ser/Thr protein kinase)
MNDGGFMPHGMCYLWRPDVLTLHIVSDALIALAYFSIPLMLLRLLKHRPDLPFKGAFVMFSVFIVSCGLTHVMGIVVIWQPWYWLDGGIKALTAASSVATAFMLVPMLPRALTLRSPAELETLNQRLEMTLLESETLLRRYEREHYIATTLQSASLGNLPARIGPLEISAMYQPGVGDLEIGGDWYDAFALPDGRVIVSIGDVAGKGLNASVIMAKMRQAIRVAAQVQVVPGAILDAADKALRLEHPDLIVTAFVGIIDDTEAYLTYANAGHPPPLLRRPDGAVTALDGAGLPLGLRLREEAADSRTVALEPGALLVLYTDGLTEATHDYAEGERRLHDALQREAPALAPDPAREIHDRVLFDGAHDDVAILTIRFGTAEDGGERWLFDSSDGPAAHATRTALAGILRQHGATTDEAAATEVVYAELIGNVARHASGPVDVRLDWNTGNPVLHILDAGAGFAFVPGLPSDILAESGRGLFIVHQLTRDFLIIPRPNGGSHARAVLPLEHPAPR